MKLNVSGEILPLSIVNFLEFEKKEKWKKKVVFVKFSKTTLLIPYLNIISIQLKLFLYLI